MILARINGYATATIGHPSLLGQTIVLCTPVNDEGIVTGSPIAALDPIGAGTGALVMISTDGFHTQERIGDKTSPLRNEVVGLIDES
jgi:ethanolamine utilization protein EutN